MKLIARERIFFQSPSPTEIFCSTPFLCRGFEQRMIASFDLAGPGVAHLVGEKSDTGDFNASNQARIYTSDDHGSSWRERTRLPMLHSRVFRAGKRLYCLGHSGRLLIAASSDNGTTWGPAKLLDDRFSYHQSGCTIDRCHGRIYLVMECAEGRNTWPDVALILMSADEQADLTRWENWRQSDRLHFDGIASCPQPFGMPFYPLGNQTPGHPDVRFNGAPGFLETNVLRIYDPHHTFYDPEDRTVVLISRLHSGTTNMAVFLRGREDADGSLHIDTFTTPGGAPFLYVPLPGGHMKFQIIYDDRSRYYWLASTQSTDSMTKPEFLEEKRYNLPNNERRRLALYYSAIWSIGAGPEWLPSVKTNVPPDIMPAC